MAVRQQRTGHTSVVTIDRPWAHNAVDARMADELDDAFREFDADPGADALVLTGARGTFCAGADLDWRFVPSGKPTVAAVEGWALGGGFELALWCDERVAAASARFSFVERRMDRGQSGRRLAALVGHGRALDLLLTGRVVGAAEALEIGLVGRVVADGRALEAATQLACRRSALASMVRW